MTGSALVTYTYFGPAFAHGGPQPSINIGVIHDIEAPLANLYARELCGPSYFGHGGDAGKPVSVHYVVGPDDICQGTDEDTIAYHVGQANPGTIGIEQCGYAANTLAEWMTDLGLLQFRNLGRLMADISARHPLIQLRWLTDSEALYALDNKWSVGGWTTHKQLSRIGRSTGHTDPGDNWPADYVMGIAQGTQPPEEFTVSQYDDLIAAINAVSAKVDAGINAAGRQVWDTPLTSLNDGKTYSAEAFVVEVDRHTDDLIAAINAVSAKVDAGINAAGRQVWDTLLTSLNDGKLYSAEAFVVEVDRHTTPKVVPS